MHRKSFTVPQCEICMKVLIVDDERIVADTTAAVFRAYGHQALTAYSAEQALEAMQEQRPNLLLTDVQMEGMSGIELAMRVCELMPECKILLFSGRGSTADLLAKARKSGYNFEIIAKPIVPKELLEKAESMTVG